MNNRRQFLVSSAGATIASLLLAEFSPKASAAETTATKPSPQKYAELINTASDCLKTGEACLAHCQEQLAKGNVAFANCNARLHEMLAVTQALMTLASLNSGIVPRYAAVCADVCKSCSEACNEHREHFSHGMHLQCKACMEACNNCEKACRKVA